jgi:preprotein translocase subunit YajC
MREVIMMLMMMIIIMSFLEMMMMRRRRRRRSLLDAASDQTSPLQKPTSANVYDCPTCAALLRIG